MNFTAKYIDSLKPEGGKKRYEREGNGFAICIEPSGLKRWYFIYNKDGKRYSMSLGSYPAVSLATARSKASAKYEELKKEKINPKIKKLEEEKADREAAEAKKEEHRKTPTVSALVTEFINKHAKLKRSSKEYERILNKEIVPVWGERKAKDITKRDVVLLIEGIMERGAPAMSNSTFRVVRKMFNFAVERDILPHSPVVGTKQQAPNTVRKRALSESEIKTVWNILDIGRLSGEPYRLALKLILVTAQRPGEVSGIHTNEIDGNWWTIPAERAKNNNTHRVYLSALAQKIITEAKTEAKKKAGITSEVQEYSGYIFPGFSLIRSARKSLPEKP